MKRLCISHLKKLGVYLLTAAFMVQAAAPAQGAQDLVLHSRQVSAAEQAGEAERMKTACLTRCNLVE